MSVTFLTFQEDTSPLNDDAWLNIELVLVAFPMSQEDTLYWEAAAVAAAAAAVAAAAVVVALVLLLLMIIWTFAFLLISSCSLFSFFNKVLFVLLKIVLLTIAFFILFF